MEKVLRLVELDALETSHATAEYGLGVVIGPNGCADKAQVFGHEGAGVGFMSAVQVSPDGRRVAVVLMNGFASTPAAQAHEETVMVNAMQRLYCAN